MCDVSECQASGPDWSGQPRRPPHFHFSLLMTHHIIPCCPPCPSPSAIMTTSDRRHQFMPSLMLPLSRHGVPIPPSERISQRTPSRTTLWSPTSTTATAPTTPRAVTTKCASSSSRLASGTPTPGRSTVNAYTPAASAPRLVTFGSAPMDRHSTPVSPTLPGGPSLASSLPLHLLLASPLRRNPLIPSSSRPRPTPEPPEGSCNRSMVESFYERDCSPETLVDAVCGATMACLDRGCSFHFPLDMSCETMDSFGVRPALKRVRGARASE